MRATAAFLVVVGALIAARPAGADAKAEAKRYFEAGVALQKAEDYGGAAASFEASIATYPTKSALFNLANCYKALRRYDEALGALERLRREFAGELSAEMAAAATAVEGEIRLMVGSLSVEVDRPGAVVSVGGRDVGTSPLPRPVLLSPGDYEVTARLPGVAYGVGLVRILPGQAQTMRLVGVADGEMGRAPGPLPAPEARVVAAPPGDATRDGAQETGRRLSAPFWTFASIGVVGLVGAGVGWGLYSYNDGKAADYAETLSASRFDDYSWDESCAAGKAFFGSDEEKTYCDTEWARRDSEDKAKVSLGIAIPSTVLFAVGGTLAIVFFSKSRKGAATGGPTAVLVSPFAMEDELGLVLSGRF